MADDNNKRVSTVATVAVAAGLGFGAYKLFQALTKNSESESNQEDQQCENRWTNLASSEHRESSVVRNPFRNQEIRIINTILECNKAMRELKSHCDEYGVIGFDCEWVAYRDIRRPVALLQLTSHRGLCLLIRLCLIEMIPAELKKILEDSYIIKVGVDCIKDAKYLNEDYGANVKGTFDLRFMAALADCNPGKLSKMTEEYLNVELDKGDVPTSNWEATVLDDKQIKYSANDSRAAIELFKNFAKKLKPTSLFRNQTDHLQYMNENYCSKFLDLRYNGCQGVPRDFIRQRMSK